MRNIWPAPTSCWHHIPLHLSLSLVNHIISATHFLCQTPKLYSYYSKWIPRVSPSMWQVFMTRHSWLDSFTSLIMRVVYIWIMFVRLWAPPCLLTATLLVWGVIPTISESRLLLLAVLIVPITLLSSASYMAAIHVFSPTLSTGGCIYITGDIVSAQQQVPMPMWII